MEITGEGESRTGTEGAIEGLLGAVLCEMTLPCASLVARALARKLLWNLNIFLCRNRKSSPSTLQYGCLERCRNVFSVRVPGELSWLDFPQKPTLRQDVRASYVLGGKTQKTLLGECKQ